MPRGFPSAGQKQNSTRHKLRVFQSRSTIDMSCIQEWEESIHAVTPPERAMTAVYFVVTCVVQYSRLNVAVKGHYLTSRSVAVPGHELILHNRTNTTGVPCLSTVHRPLTKGEQKQPPTSATIEAKPRHQVSGALCLHRQTKQPQHSPPLQPQKQTSAAKGCPPLIGHRPFPSTAFLIGPTSLEGSMALSE